MLVALDEGPGPPIKYQYAELAKLYAVVSQLIRCCDVTSKCQSSVTVSVNNHLSQSMSIIYHCQSQSSVTVSFNVNHLSHSMSSKSGSVSSDTVCKSSVTANVNLLSVSIIYQ